MVGEGRAPSTPHASGQATRFHLTPQGDSGSEPNAGRKLESTPWDGARDCRNTGDVALKGGSLWVN